MAWQKNGTPDTLGSELDIAEITDLTAVKFNMILGHLLNTGSINSNWRLDGISATDYARRRSRNGGADGTEINQTSSNMGNGQTGDELLIGYVINIDSEEKLIISFGSEQEATGAGNVPSRTEHVGKMDTTTNTAQFTEVSINNSSTGGYVTSTNLSALGTD
jgi:hypothetical protein